MFVKPKEGLKILRPDTHTVLAKCGEHVPKTSFWLKRVKQKDVSLIDIEEKKVSVKPSDKKKKIINLED